MADHSNHDINFCNGYQNGVDLYSIYLMSFYFYYSFYLGYLYLNIFFFTFHYFK